MRSVGLSYSQDRLSYAIVIKNTYITRLETIRIYLLLLRLIKHHESLDLFFQVIVILMLIQQPPPETGVAMAVEKDKMVKHGSALKGFAPK